MGCDIHMVFERKTEAGYEAGYEAVEVQERDRFDNRNYLFFGWLAGVRAQVLTPPVAKGRGIPADSTAPSVSDYGVVHGRSWVSVQELLEYVYDQELVPGRSVAEELGVEFFAALYTWRYLGVDRVVFWFDG